MALTKVRGLGLGTLDDNITFSTAGKGVHLGVTSATSSNLMDDYEEGTFTPTMTDGSTTVNGDSNTGGHYTKVGQMVFVTGHINIDTVSSTMASFGSSAVIKIGGLPFASVSGDSRFSTLNVGYSAQWVADNFPVGIYIPPNVSYALLLKGRGDDHRDGKGLVISPASLTNNTGKNEVMVSGTYRTA